MNKQLVNVIGAAAVVAILVLGVVVVALPLFSTAGTTAASADDVARQNRTQQTLLDTLTAQAADMTEIDAAVAELRAEIPDDAHRDDVLLLAAQAATDNGATVTSVTPAEPEEFAARVAETDAAAAPAAETTAETTETSETTDADATPAPAAVAAPAADAPRQIAVTVVVDAPDVPTATRVLDALRAGPRVVAVTQAGVATKTEGGATLTATLLAFYRP